MSNKHVNHLTTVNTDRLDDDDKIAITGIGCRYGDGVAGPLEMWDMLKEMRDCTSSHPPERFDKSTFFYPGEKKKGKLYTQAGGYLKQDPFMFDRQFFKISPDEAEHMDPQIRILLEVVWESIADAGIPASTLRGSNTGVYMGVTANEYLTLTGLPQSNIGQYTNSGTNSCMIANRISYEFDLRGPSFSIDTACSSSLYAVQIACDALRRGVCDRALAGGVNIILTPSVTIGFCQAGMLSPDGRCKSFDESANGYSRSEGVGSVVLKPLKMAMADGDRIYAVIRGGALTNDGRTPGIANPSFDAQIDLVHKACAAAKVDPRDVAYIEAHGTGTPVGDKTEANAIGEAMSKQRSGDMPPLYIGSIKSNVGHAEGAAGIAGVIKTALSLYHRKIPGVVHFKRGNPNINFKDLKLRVPSSITPWPVDSKLLAGCSSFGFGGANAHIVLEAAPPVKNNKIKPNNTPSTSIQSYHMLILSAQSLGALEQMFINWKIFLSSLVETNNDMFRNLLYTANTRTQRHEQRAFCIAKSKDDLLLLLQKRINGESSDAVIEGKAPMSFVNRTVFVFSGMGTQWWGMARDLMSTQPVFSNIIELIDDCLRKNGARWSLIQMLSEETDKERINSDTEISQTCICSLQIGLVELYKYYGITPSAIIGHSVGEVAAAYAAGLITMAVAIKIILKRGNLLRITSGSGTMAAVLHDVDDVQIRLKSTTTFIDVAAINSPTQIVLSGKTDSINQFASELHNDGIQTRILKVNNAFHSRQQEILKKDFFKKTGFLKKAKYPSEHRPLIPMMSTVTNHYLTLQEANTSDYWWSNIRQQVRFKEAVESVLKDGYNSFLEIGAHPALSPAIKDILASQQNPPTIHFITHSLKRPRDINSPGNDTLNFNISLAQLLVNGYPVDMKQFYQGYHCDVESLPLYPWQRIECSATADAGDINMRYPNTCHPILGSPETSANYSNNSSLRIWKATIGTNKEPWIADHILQNSVVLPAAGFIETAIAAYHHLFTDIRRVVITDLSFDRFLFVSENGTRLETTTEIDYGGKAKLSLCSFNDRENKWMTHTTMNLKPNNDEADEEQTFLHVTAITNKCHKDLDKAGFYAIMKNAGFNLGESFTCVENVNYSKFADEALIYVCAPEAVTAQSSRFYVHPAYIDSVLQTVCVMAGLRVKIYNPNAQLAVNAPRAVKSVHLNNVHFPHNVILHYKLTITSGNDNGSEVDISIADAVTHEVIGKFGQISIGSVAALSDDHLRLWEKRWVRIYPNAKHNNEEDDQQNMITGDDDELSKQLRNSLIQVGIHAETVTKDIQISHTAGPSNIVMVFKSGNKDDLQTISKDDLLNNQSQIANMCIQQYSNTLSRNDTRRRSNMWIITRDGFPANDKHHVDPTQASAYGFALCVMQEDPTLKIFIVDVPSDISNEKASKWLIDYIWRTDHCDNIVALRHPKQISDGPYEAHSLRVIVNKPDEFKYKVASSNWKFNIKECLQSGKMGLIENISDVDLQYTTHIAVKVRAFHLMKTTGDNVDEQKHVALFCGQNGNDFYIGICSDKHLKSTIDCHSGDILQVRNNSIQPEEVVNIVLKYLIPFGVLRSLSCKKSTMIICMSSNKDTIGLAMAHMAIELGHNNVLVAVKDLSERNGVHLHAEHTVHILDNNQVHRALHDNSVGILIGCEAMIRELLQLHNMKDKLKPFAVIAILDSKASTKSKIHGLPRTSIVQNIDYDIYSNSELRQMKPILDELLQVIDKPSSKIIRLKDDLMPQVNSLQAIGKLEVINSLQDMTVVVGDDPVLTSYDFTEGDIVFQIDESYLVTGGTKGFGLCLVEWLSNKGAGCIYILSRTDAEPNENERLNVLKRSGTTIVHIKTDITSRSAMERAFKQILSDASYQLSGIFHCAAQYGDKLLNDITPEIWKTVMAAKSWGALLLHQTSIKYNVTLKYFVMISSIVQMLGNSGQASYCAANTFLSSLGYFRRSNNLPATVFCPGVIRGDGYAARTGLIKFWERKGVESLSPTELLNGLGIIIRSGAHEIGLSGNFRCRDFIVDNRTFTREHITSPHGRFSIVKGFGVSLDEVKLYIGDSGQNDISEHTPEEARSYIFNKLCGFISQRLGITEPISPDASPPSLGVDSLMTTELSDIIQSTFGIFVPPMELMNANITLQDISASIYKKYVAEKQHGNMVNDVEEEEEVDTSWKAWYIMDESIVSPEIQLVCFPPNGGGPSAYAWWQNHFGKHSVQLIMAQLPGWEGRHLEKPLQTMEEITINLADHLAARLVSGKFVLFGHSLGGLIAFEVAHRLLERNIRPAHVIISSWYAPTLPYPHAMELDKAPTILQKMEQDINNNIRLTDDNTLRLSFVDDDVLENSGLMKRLIPCFRVGFNICKMYSRNHRMKLQCGMTVFGAKTDRFISPATLDAWCLEIDKNQHFKKILVPGGHMHITHAKKKFFKDIQAILKDAVIL